MLNVFLALALIAFMGSMIRYVFPSMDVESLRKSINKIVLYFILPALIFNVVYKSEVGKEFIHIPLTATAGIFAALIFSVCIYHFTNLPSRTKGALILAASFSNVTYLGLPVLQGIFPDIPEKISVVAVLFEVTTSPVLLSIGALIAVYYGNKSFYGVKQIVKKIVSLPPIWALILVLVVKFLNIPVPAFILITTKTLGSIATGLMILSLGMALKFKKINHLPWLLPAILIQLFLIPAVAYIVGKGLQMNDPFFEASVIEAAMPTQLLTLVVADEFDLDTEMLAFVIFLSTIASLITIPLIRTLLF
jgi:malate permease and related proteins